MEMICPATTKAWNSSCRTKPSMAPMRISQPISSSARGLSASTCGIGGRLGTRTTQIASARYRRTRVGTNWVPMIGMVISSAATRNSGQTKLPIQPPICALLSSNISRSASECWRSGSG
ncbi:hypothetical protein D9M70_603930 [compost metagenome]